MIDMARVRDHYAQEAKRFISPHVQRNDSMEGIHSVPPNIDVSRAFGGSKQVSMLIEKTAAKANRNAPYGSPQISPRESLPTPLTNRGAHVQ